MLGQDSLRCKEHPCCFRTVQGESSIRLALDGMTLADTQTQTSEEADEAMALLQGSPIFGRACRIERARAPSKCCLFSFSTLHSQLFIPRLLSNTNILSISLTDPHQEPYTFSAETAWSCTSQCQCISLACSAESSTFGLRTRRRELCTTCLWARSSDSPSISTVKML